MTERSGRHRTHRTARKSRNIPRIRGLRRADLEASDIQFLQDELNEAIRRGKELVDDWIELKRLGKRAQKYC